MIRKHFPYHIYQFSLTSIELKHRISKQYEQSKTGLGDFLKDIRLRNQWILAQVSTMSSLPVSTLSKVENNQMSLTYDRLVQLAHGLKVDIFELFRTPAIDDAPNPLGRRTFTLTGDGRPIKTQNYDYLYLCTEISKKSMVPIFAPAHARTLEEFVPLIRHQMKNNYMCLRNCIPNIMHPYVSRSVLLPVAMPPLGMPI